MYAIINSKVYRDLKSLTFNLNVDISALSLPMTEMRVKIITEDSIANNQYILLYDDMNQIWCKYWIVDVDKVGDKVYSIVAMSRLYFYENVTAEEALYVNRILGDFISDWGSNIKDRSSLSTNLVPGITITGYCPPHSARERLAWTILIAHAYIKAWFNDSITMQVREISDSSPLYVPFEDVFYKPTITYNDYVTGLDVFYYDDYTGTTQSPSDLTVADLWFLWNTYYTTYVQYEWNYRRVNLPSGTPDNILNIMDVTLLNKVNYMTVAFNAYGRYRNRLELDATIINNRKYSAGDYVIVPIDEDTAVMGYIESCEFHFGNQSASKIHVVAGELTDLLKLTIQCMYGEELLREIVKILPANYPYSIQNEYIDKTEMMFRNIYYPEDEYIQGTMGTADETVTQDYGLALSMDYASGVLYILSVDGVSESGGIVELE